jgi:glucose-6-phosphate isomerase
MLASTDKRAYLQDSLRVAAGPLTNLIHVNADSAERAARGLWRRDPSVWSGDPATQKKIADRLGWMSSPQLMAESIPRLGAFADAVKRDGFTDVVLSGMGGSSLAPEVIRACIGVATGWPRFQMLDSTDPAAVLAAATPPERTLYVLASKSGTTIEPNSLAAHFKQTLLDAGVARWAQHFIAITDEGTALAARARAEGFREVFINPSDIGGRYSALSFFGLVPAALMGVDVDALVGWGLAMLEAADPNRGAGMSRTAAQNPAVALGLAMGAGAKAGRDKLTLVLPQSLEAFGLWVEQLVAESTGKQGTGIVPIAGEPHADRSAYGSDRLFVRLRTNQHDASVADEPRVDLEIPEPVALGAEFVRWEIATAIAGALLEINPFDEPNVQQAKDATRKLLDEYRATGRLPMPAPDRSLHGIDLTSSRAARQMLKGQDPDAILTLISAGDYAAWLAYLGPDRALADELASLRRAIRDRTRAATMFGDGPRYLHSTGQLHKGGPNTGVFVLVTATPVQDLPIPGEPFSFGTLELAQALGDFASLDATGRRALHAHLPSPDPALLRRLGEDLLARLPSRAP